MKSFCVDYEKFLREGKEALERYKKTRKVFIFSDQLRNAITKSGSRYRYGNTFIYSISGPFFDL